MAIKEKEDLIFKENLNMKVNIYVIKNGMGKVIIEKAMQYMN